MVSKGSKYAVFKRFFFLQKYDVIWLDRFEKSVEYGKYF